MLMWGMCVVCSAAGYSEAHMKGRRVHCCHGAPLGNHLVDLTMVCTCTCKGLDQVVISLLYKLVVNTLSY